MKARVRSLRELHKLNLVRPQITKAGGLFRARWYGKTDSVFGVSREDAETRLRNASRSGFMLR
jgi:hypothetical protein